MLQVNSDFYYDDTLLHGATLASQSSPHVGRYSLSVCHCMRPHLVCFGRQGTQGSAITAFNPLAAWRCVLCRQGFPSSVCQVVMGVTRVSTTKADQHCWEKWAGGCAQEGVPHNAISASKLVDFLAHLLGVVLTWCSIGIYFCVI